MALAHTVNFTGKRKMEFLVEAVFNRNITLPEALKDFELGQTAGFHFSEKERTGLTASLSELANYSFLAEELLNRGIKVISIFDKDYPKTLKSNLKMSAPVLLYARGNTDLLSTECVAIVGARKSSSISLDFTDRMAEKAVSRHQTIVSGFAKGVDRQALDSALKYNGRSIIVLPQGINTYHSKTYYPEITKGNVLVISTYHPRAPWSVGLAMDRNNTIYGMADEIYVAESDSKGGTWAGVLNGLKKGWKIFVRMPGANEKNANLLLIEKGAVPVDMDGNELEREMPAANMMKENDLFYGSSEKEEEKEEKLLSKEELIQAVVVLLNEKKGSLFFSEIEKQFKTKVKENTVKKWLKSSSLLHHEGSGKDLRFNLPERIVTNKKLF